MVQFASTTPPAPTAGVPYATNVVLLAAEGELFNTNPPVPDSAPPVEVPYWQAVLATVFFQARGTLTANTSYVVMQGDMGDSNWIDLAWCTWTGLTGTALFFLSQGAYIGNAGQQARTAGTNPVPATGAIQCPIPDRIRFVGKATVNAGSSSSSPGPSSSSPGVAAAVLVTIRYRLLGLR